MDPLHTHEIERWTHEHRFNVADARAERRTQYVILLTLTMMVVEIGGGLLFGSMALLADGWHMGTHAAALGITAFAYWFARKHESDESFTFGTGKVGVLGGYTSAIVLALVALLMAGESIHRLLSPVSIRFNEAIVVAVLGLAVNVLSALLLQRRHPELEHSVHDHDQGPEHGHEHDYNLRAAYLHVLADALTSVFAIVALSAGNYAGWTWMDPAMGIVGAGVILFWAWGLVLDTGSILLDSGVSRETAEKIRKAIEADADNRVADLHVWVVGRGKLAGVLSIVTHHPRPVEHYRALLSGFESLYHLTIEVNRCPGDVCGK